MRLAFCSLLAAGHGEVRLALFGIAVAVAAPAHAEPEADARLVRCGAEDCLEIRGRSEVPGSLVKLNGQAVPIEGERRWRVQVPVERVREWSAPFARSIEVSQRDATSEVETIMNVALPVGMLGGVEMSSLVVRLN